MPRLNRILGLARQPYFFLWAYLGLISAAELLVALVSPIAGLALHAAVLMGLLLRCVAQIEEEPRRLVLGMTLAPLIRMLSLGLPLARLPQLMWYPLVAIPLLLTVWLIIRQLRLSHTQLGLRRGNLLVQLMLPFSGVGLGALEYLILRPAPLAPHAVWYQLLLPAFILVVFTGFVEELIFRGVLQSLAVAVLGRWALIYISALFGVLHIGYLSLIDVAFVTLVGLLFAWIVRWGGSLVGVSLAHGAANVMLFLVMPLLAQQHQQVPELLVLAPAFVGALTFVVIMGILAMQSQLAPQEAAYQGSERRYTRRRPL